MILSTLAIRMLLFAGCAALLYVLVKRMAGGPARGCNRDETEMIQQLHRDLDRMSRRVEALETILMERSEAWRSTPPPVPRNEHAER